MSTIIRVRPCVAALAGLLIMTACALAPAPAAASTVIFRTDAELASLADRVVHARVVRQRAERPDGPDGAIYTVTTLAVMEDFTGVAGREIDVWELGGIVGDQIMWVAGAVHYEIGGEVLVFLEQGRFGFRSVAMGFSKFDVRADGGVVRNMGDTAVVGGPALRAPERTLDEFRALTAGVRRVQPVRNDEADLAQPEGGAYAAYTLLLFGNGHGPRWTEADSGIPINWYINTSAPAPVAPASGVSELQLALSAWTAPTTASIALQYAGTTNQSAATGPWTGISNSATGVLTFEDPNNEISGSTLAVGGGVAFYDSGGTVNGTVFNKYSRAYIIFQNAADLGASYKQSTNFARVLEHEVGHTIGLGHSTVQSAIMYPSCCSASTPVAPNLGADDLAGLEFIYPTASTPPVPCTYSIGPASVSSVPGAGSTGVVSVLAGAGCGWTATVDPGSTFLSVTGGSSGTGNGQVNYSVAATTTLSPRSGSITIAGQAFTVSQLAGTCSYTLSATAASSPSGGGGATVNVTPNISACAWSATSNSAFLGITSGASGAGSGSVGYSASANSAVSYRIGLLTIAGQTFTVTQSGTGPTMAVDRSSLYFGAVSSGASFGSQTLGQAVRLTQAGAGSVSWTAASNVPWLSVSPTSGTGAATLTLTVAYHATVPFSGNTTGAVTLSFTGAGTPAAPIAVSLRTYPNGTSSGSAGSLDTPSDGVTGVTGSIAVSGWALDDVEVRQVRIVRDPIAGEGAGLIPIGTAVFVDGSRPDVYGIFSTIPRGTRGGWGYLMLTNFLPNAGNGTFRIHAYADDADGHSTLIGSKTITCANDTATTPFGAIDTPQQGETISGAAFPNFGWVLARGIVRADPPYGAVTVLIDGVPAGTPGGWAARSDLTSLFPSSTYSGVANALGIVGIDTTSLSNGLHTIAWIVTADNGRSEGIGSRFFTVDNTSAPVTGAAQAAIGTALTDEVNRASEDRSVIVGRRGYDLDLPYRRIAAVGRDARATIYGEEMDRFELRLPSADPGTAGYLRTAGGLMPLPAGSHLETATGTFTWQPGPGFLGDYDLVFVRFDGGRAVARHEVRVAIAAKRSNRVGAQITVDAPVANAVVSGPFMLGGWAVDMDSLTGAGIETIHVWAYPAGGAAPRFVGVATLNGRRPDVAAVVGDRFADSGFGLIVDGLPPGTYDLALFPWVTGASDFAPATLVRVSVR